MLSNHDTPTMCVFPRGHKCPGRRPNFRHPRILSPASLGGSPGSLSHAAPGGGCAHPRGRIHSPGPADLEMGHRVGWQMDVQGSEEGAPVLICTRSWSGVDSGQWLTLSAAEERSGPGLGSDGRLTQATRRTHLCAHCVPTIPGPGERVARETDGTSRNSWENKGSRFSWSSMLWNEQNRPMAWGRQLEQAGGHSRGGDLEAGPTG